VLTYGSLYPPRDVPHRIVTHDDGVQSINHLIFLPRPKQQTATARTLLRLRLSSFHAAEHIGVIYKTALIAYKALKTGQPVYLRDLLHYHQPAHTLRSSSQLLGLLYQPAARINFQSKAFSFAAPTVWNSLSSYTKSSTTITIFKAHLKTELFAAAYDSVKHFFCRRRL